MKKSITKVEYYREVMIEIQSMLTESDELKKDLHEPGAIGDVRRDMFDRMNNLSMLAKEAQDLIDALMYADVSILQAARIFHYLSAKQQIQGGKK